MKKPAAKFIKIPELSLSYWIALCSGLMAYSIVIQSLAFPLLIGAGAIALQSFSPQSPPKLQAAARILFTLLAYLAALLPLWPNGYTEHWGLPIFLITTVSLVAAFNQRSFGGSRAVSSIAAIAFLLFLRNVFLYFEFQAPIKELTSTLAFVSLMEIALSKRYQENEDSPHPELVFGLIIALIASFHFSSLPLAILLSCLPITSFLLRNHEQAKLANEHTREATPTQPTGATRKKWQSALAGLPLALACILYLLSLKIPFWADYVPKYAPYYAVSMASAAQNISKASDLEDEKIESIADAVVSRKFIEEKAQQIASSLKADQRQPAKELDLPTQIVTDAPRTSNVRNPNSNPENEYGYNPFKRDRASSSYQIEQEDTVTETYQSPWDRSRPAPMLTPPRAELGDGIPDDLGMSDLSPIVDKSIPPPNRADGSKTSEENAAELFEQLQASSDFDRFLEAFEQPEQAITQALNLQGSDVSALLSEEPLVTVKVNDSRDAPRKLYLRSNVLDTISQIGFGGSRDKDGRIPIVTAEAQIVETKSFLQSQSQAATVTITSAPNRFPTLPLPESFGEFQIFDVDEINIYPEDRVALAPPSGTPITYRLHKADLDITNRERKESYISKGYRDRMLEIPLSPKDSKYIAALARRVGGSRSPPMQFAYRFANYFANRHEYSYFVEIPEGEGHPVVRWLKNECPGLCSNYAAAFTLLARSRGIPTRVVSGFASNEFDPIEQRYILRQNNAHAWVEFLNESNQWIRFDPTPGISEAEVRRSQSYTTAADPNSLAVLLQAEKAATSEQELIEQAFASPPETASHDDLYQVDPLLGEEPQKPQAAPAPSERDPFSLEEAQDDPAPPKSIEPSIPPLEPVELADKALEPTPEPEPEPASTAASALSEPEAYEQRNAGSATDPGTPPWLLILLILLFGLPTIYLLLKHKSAKHAPAQLQLRGRAGRLLAQLDSLIRQHELSSDPVWAQTRATLAAQRYGREANSLLIQDSAVKIALLAKRKQPKRHSER